MSETRTNTRRLDAEPPDRRGRPRKAVRRWEEVLVRLLDQEDPTRWLRITPPEPIKPTSMRVGVFKAKKRLSTVRPEVARVGTRTPPAGPDGRVSEFWIRLLPEGES